MRKIVKLKIIYVIIVTFSLLITKDSVTFAKENSQIVAEFTSGTGFFVNQNHIVTNHHVVENCHHIRIRGAVAPGYAEIVAYDKINDLAVLKTHRRSKNIAKLRGNMDVKQGEKVFVMGYPLEHGLTGDYVIKHGEVLSMDDSLGGTSRFQFTDTVEKGNSGGPLMDFDGTVVGVVVGKMNFYLTDTKNNEKMIPVKTTSVAIKTDLLKTLLQNNNIFYSTTNIKTYYSPQFSESLAKDYIVNVHCVKGDYDTM